LLKRYDTRRIARLLICPYYKKPIMQRCSACGFEALKEGKPCPICGSTEHEATIFRKVSGTVEIVDPPAPKKTPTGKRNKVYPKDYLYAERYRIEEFVGRGGMGSVYRVYDTVENGSRALKTLHPSIADEQDGEQRFMREIEVLPKIKHPAIPKVFGWGRHGEELYFVAEFISGRDLKTEIKTRGPWPGEEAAKVIATIADALSVAHSM
jgi:hypothetical protein